MRYGLTSSYSKVVIDHILLHEEAGFFPKKLNRHEDAKGEEEPSVTQTLASLLGLWVKDEGVMRSLREEFQAGNPFVR